MKVYSHGDQSAAEIVHRTLGPMLGDLEGICRERRIQLHYMTAREAYNVAKAAEEGKCGNPGDFRDYRIPKPRNMVFPLDSAAGVELSGPAGVTAGLSSSANCRRSTTLPDMRPVPPSWTLHDDPNSHHVEQLNLK